MVALELLGTGVNVFKSEVVVSVSILVAYDHHPVTQEDNMRYLFDEIQCSDIKNSQRKQAGYDLVLQFPSM